MTARIFIIRAAVRSFISRWRSFIIRAAVTAFYLAFSAGTDGPIQTMSSWGHVLRLAIIGAVTGIIWSAYRPQPEAVEPSGSTETGGHA